MMQEELEVPYELKKYQRTPERLAPPELKAVNPLGNAPVITDGNLNLAESGAIVGTCFCGLQTNALCRDCPRSSARTVSLVLPLGFHASEMIV